MFQDPVSLVSALGFTNEAAANFAALRERRKSFAWTHLGTRDLPLGRLMGVLRSQDGLCPPRSGHLGNWEDIVLGRGGAMDFNHAICAGGLGYPLIYAFNQTENRSLTSGDAVYMPGSVATRGKRTALPLLTWDGSDMRVRDRDVPLFVPFVMTEYEGERVPLTQLHWRLMQQTTGFAFRLEAAIVHEHRDEVKAMLLVLLEAASGQPNPRRALGDVIGHAVHLDGRIARTVVARDGDGYRIDDAFFPSAEALVDAALIPFAAVAEPAAFFEELGRLPAVLPVITSRVVGIFSAIFATHYPGRPYERATMTQPFNAHFHWGARDMAGYPPKRSGYFGEKSATRSMQSLCDTLVANFPDVDPLYFVMMPAAMFMLCPSNAHPGDADALAALFHEVLAETRDYLDTTDDRMMAAIDHIVDAWLTRSRAVLSPYFLDRFKARRGVVHDTDTPAQSTTVHAEGFEQLTTRQACMIVGALHELLQRDTPLAHPASEPASSSGSPVGVGSASDGSGIAQPVSIRPARREDLPAVVRLFALPDEGNMKGDDATEPLDPRYLAAFDAIVDDPDNRLYVGERDGQLVGVFHLTIVQYIAYRGGRVAQIENVVVVPAERGRGVGMQLMRWAVDEARRRGCFRVQLTSRKGRERAHAFYERLGFSRSHEGFRLTL